MSDRYVLIALLLLGANCCGAAEMGINCMLVGKQVLEVTDTHQLTLRDNGKVAGALVSPDGKYVVYMAERQDTLELRLAKISTGKTVTIMSRESIMQRPASNETWSLDYLPGTAWSPDSSMFAFACMHLTWEAGKKTEQQYIVVFSAAGAFRKSLLLHSPREDGDNCRLVGNLLFTPDSRKILADMWTRNLDISERVHPLKAVVRLIDISTGTSQNIYEPKSVEGLTEKSVISSRPPRIVGWSGNGALLCVIWGEQTGELHRMALDGSSDEILLSNSRREEVWSPDANFAVLDDRGLSIRSLQAPAATTLVDSADVSLAAWAPNGRMIFYDKKETMSDAAKLRKRDFQSLWLSGIEPGKFNSLCIALEAEGNPSSSRDCRKIAYISQGQLYIAELTLREPTVYEKLIAGIPLTEEEMKQTLLANGKQIAAGIMMYCADWRDQLPPADSAAKALQPYVDESVFLRPGTQDNVFRYIDPGVGKRDDIEDTSATVIGELDAGYGWKVMIYADRHVTTQAKQ